MSSKNYKSVVNIYHRYSSLTGILVIWTEPFDGDVGVILQENDIRMQYDLSRM